MRDVVIVGAGGHGRETAEILAASAAAGGCYRPIGFIDHAPELLGRTINGLPVLGDSSWLRNRLDLAVVVALGNPLVLHRVVAEMRAMGLDFAQAVSPAALVSPTAELGPGVILFAGSIVNANARIGACTTLNVGATVSHDSVVGECCLLNPGARLAGNVRVGQGSDIGMGANVIQGRTIGCWTTVGAGAAVVRDLPDHVTAVGVPARVIKRKADGEDG